MLQLVDNQGQTIGLLEKMAAHEDGGVLHRAVSVILLDSQGRMLVQRRAASKYHFAGKWANASCTHPHLIETPEEAGRRALRQELGIETELSEVTHFIYLAHDPESGYTEQEYDHVLLGIWDAPAKANPEEVAEIDWLTPDEVKVKTTNQAEDFAFWFLQILKELVALYRNGSIESTALRQFVRQYNEA